MELGESQENGIKADDGNPETAVILLQFKLRFVIFIYFLFLLASGSLYSKARSP